MGRTKSLLTNSYAKGVLILVRGDRIRIDGRKKNGETISRTEDMPEEIMSPPNLNSISRTKFKDKRESEVLISNKRIKSIPKETVPLLKDDQEKSKEINSGVDVLPEEIRLDFQRLEKEAEMRKTLWTCEPILWSDINYKTMYELLTEGERTMPIQEGLTAADYEKKLKEYIFRSRFKSKTRPEVSSAGERSMPIRRGFMPPVPQEVRETQQKDDQEKSEETISRTEDMRIRRGFMPPVPQEVRETQQKDDQEKSEETISRTEDMRKEIMSALQQKIIETEQKDCQMKEDTIASRVHIPLLRGSKKKGKQIISEMLSYLKTMEENEGGTDSRKKEKEEAEFEYRKMLGDLTPEHEDHVDAYLDDVEGITEDEIEELFSKMNNQDASVLSSSALHARWIEKMDELFVEDSARKGLEKYNMEHETDYVLDKITDRQYLPGLVSLYHMPYQLHSLYHINFIAKSPSTNNEKEMFFVEARQTPKGGGDVTVCRKFEESVGIYLGCRICTSHIFHPCGVDLNPEPVGPPRQPWVTIPMGSL